MISAKIILDSVSPEGHRLTTFELRYPKFIHGEFMTHRVFSRNASSSRAIPTKKYLEEVRSDELRACPVFWGKNQAGMQAAEELTGSELIDAKHAWARAALNAADIAEEMMVDGVHKQIVNRILEPFIHINVVVTATEYMNFFGLRLDAGAQPEIRALAETMWAAYNRATPIRPNEIIHTLRPGQWHLPYVKYEPSGSNRYQEGVELTQAIRQSVARCARVSYRSFETGKESTLDEDLALYDKLLGSQPIHASPAEHQATPDSGHFIHGLTQEARPDGRIGIMWDHPAEQGNFVGWCQYRKMLPGEAIAPLPEKYR
jgi:thymidylate synthase ThyX